VLVAWVEGWIDAPSMTSLALFAVGWASGWFLLWTPRRLPQASVPASRPTVAVVVPARDEAHIIDRLIGPLVAQLRAGDELVVVDDHSTDGTAGIAARCGATVITAPSLPDGWAGKPHACHVGAASVAAELIVFVDADVVPASDLLDRVAAMLVVEPDALVSVQPWHRPGRGARHAAEHLCLVCNVVALMGSGAFSPLGPHRAGRLAFGPVLACRRDRYDAVGGHGAPAVRGAILEDIALARCFEQRQLFVGALDDTTFRMYPTGARAMIEGWTKGMAIGADAAPWWAALGAAAWVSSVAGGWLASCWFAAATAAQIAVLGRRAGRFAPWSIVLFPLSTAVFVAVVLRSLMARRSGGQVSWRGRRLTPDQDTD
jgi:4,4'-diaponeurosporenoate glycosyltransferase